ncbi:MAG: DUF5690 family protein [Bacteroidota bacterium]
MLTKLQRRLQQSDLAFGIWTGLAAFCAYFCMYMYRKPYTAGTYEGMELWGIDYKVILVIAQVIGYALSKFIGIKVIAELKHGRRLALFLVFISVAWLALVGFAFTPMRWGPLWLFINGLPLGMIWGILFTYCEGRKLTEVITVLIACNFIITSGIAKTLGRWILGLGYSEQMMPMIAGLLVVPLFLISLWMLCYIPPPSQQEVALKSPRPAMDGQAKQQFLQQYRLPLVLFVLIYLVLTIVRDIRDNFAVEIWTGLGYGESPEIFSTTELPVTLVILMSLGLLYRIKDNQQALRTNVLICLAGIALLLLTTILHQAGQLSAVIWMVISGIGLFLPYILFNGIIFDRFIASYRISGNVGFIMYIADAFGYLGSIVIMLFKNFGNSELVWLEFYTYLCLGGGVLGLLLVLVLLWYVRQSMLHRISTS